MTEKKRFKSNEDENKPTKDKYDKHHYDGSDELIFYDDDIDWGK